MRLIKEDYIILGAVILQFAVRFVFVTAVYMLESVTRFTGVAVAVEANPIINQIMQLNGQAVILLAMVSPAFVLAVYWWFRREYMKNPHKYQFVLPVFAVFMFLVSAINLLNDSAALLGLLLRQGII